MATAKNSTEEINVGDRVRLIAVPQWLLNGLPEDEQRTLIAFIGQCSQVTDKDQYGYYWIGFGGTSVGPNEDATYEGHSFCVTEACLKKVSG